MDGVQFDSLTRRLARDVARRRLGGALAALALARKAVPETGAKRRKKKKKKKQKQPNPNPSCLNGTAGCRGACVDTQNDEDHCGVCGRRCAAGETCQGGNCTAVCDPPCPTDRHCHAGKCTCLSNLGIDGECIAREDPDGDHCLGQTNIPGHGTCTCLNGNYRVCAPGERCSRYCNQSDCPGEDQILVVPPENTYRNRTCCYPTGFLLFGLDPQFCCGFRGEDGPEGRRCVCAPPGAPCGWDVGCCSGSCNASSGECA